MPILNGYATTEEFRKYEKENNLTPVPIVAVTADVIQKTLFFFFSKLNWLLI